MKRRTIRRTNSKRYKSKCSTRRNRKCLQKRLRKGGWGGAHFIPRKSMFMRGGWGPPVVGPNVVV